MIQVVRNVPGSRASKTQDLLIARNEEAEFGVYPAGMCLLQA